MKPKGPSLSFFLKHLKNLTSDPLKLLLEASQQYGEVVDLGGGMSPVYLVNHPDAVKQVLLTDADQYERGANMNHLRSFVGNGLLTSNGEVWKRQRQLMQSSFHLAKLQHSLQDMIEPTVSMLEQWEHGKTYPMLENMMVVTQQIILRIVFDVQNHPRERAEALNDHLDTVQHYLTWASMQEAIFIGMSGIFGRKNMDWMYERVSRKRRKKFESALHTWQAFAQELIQQKRAKMQESDADLLAILIRDEGEGGMSAQQLEDEVMTLFFAGYDTTGNSMAWICWLLATHPDVQERLFNEIQTVLKGATPSYQDLGQMPYLQAVIDESLRLYPVAWAAYRTPIADGQICGYDIPKNASVLVIPYLIQRHPSFWSQPDVFNPDRFMEKKADDYGLSYFPFNAGRHACIGRRLGVLEMKIILSLMLQRFCLIATTQAPLLPKAMITLYPSTNVPIRVEARL